MDLTPYYEEFQFTINIAGFTVGIAIFAVIFVGIRRIRDPKDSVKIKVINIVLLLIILASVLAHYFRGPDLAKKDIAEKTIYYYEGTFEITEISYGIHEKAVFSINGEQLELKLATDKIEIDDIEPGVYKGEIVYAQHAAHVLHLEIYEEVLD